MAENKHTTTSTQIRNLYSDGISCMNIKFYNTNLGFHLYPFVGKDQNGRSNYDTKNGQQTTVSYDGAFALYQMCKDIINGKISEGIITVPCVGASITLERKLGLNGPETVFSLTKNNVTIPFRFQTIQQQIKENGSVISKTIESGVGAFMMTVEGYLTGVNADRHLDKMTEEYSQLNGGTNGQQNQNQQNNQPQQNNQQRQFRPNNYNNNKRNGYNNNNHYNNNRNNGGNWNNNQQPQNFNDYSIQ